MTYLAKEVFQTVVANTPLISIDLIVRDSTGRVLLGYRRNRPAQFSWFVPGGRIAKGEPIAQAFARLTQLELGLDLPLVESSYLGLYEHFYDDSAVASGVTTHYVVNAFSLLLDQKGELLDLPKDQHSEYRWLTVDELLEDDAVHLHTKWYFQKDKGYKSVS